MFEVISLAKSMPNSTARRRLMEAKSKLLNAMVNNKECSKGALMDRCVKIIRDLDYVVGKLK